MLCLRDLSTPPGTTGPRRRAATIGFFDGIHVGHQKLFRELRLWAAELDAEPAVVTFNRHPRVVLGAGAPRSVLSLRHRLVLMEREGIGAVLVVPFTRELSRWSPEEFLDRVFRNVLGADHVLLGFDSAFGRGRRGTYGYLAREAPSLGFTVRQAGVEEVAGERVSSTLVRSALEAGDLARLEVLLGRTYSVLGRVAHGDGRGRTLGYPTANIDVEDAALPPPGVYFADVAEVPAPFGGESPARPGPPLHFEDRPARIEAGGKGPEASWRRGAVVNVGVRPTFRASGSAGSLRHPALEAHLLDFDGDLYGRWLELRFLARHRDEREFPSAEALQVQIRTDLEAFRRLFGSGAPFRRVR